MTAQTPAAVQTLLFPGFAAGHPKMRNPLAFTENGVPVFRVRKNDDNPTSPLLMYWYSFFADNSQPIDVRTLPGYAEPEYDASGSVLERSERWTQALATEAERVMRNALQTGLFARPPQ